MSCHVSSVATKETENDTVQVTSYVHLFGPCLQDWFEDLFCKIKTDMLNIEIVRIRSDEAGCYHNSELIAAVKDIGA